MPRNIAVCLLFIYGNEPLAGVDRYFNINSYSTISRTTE
jgi:hypothetical protein